MDENTRKLSEVIKAMNDAVAGDMTADDVEKIADGLADIIAGLKEELGDDCLTNVCPYGCDVSMHEIDDDLPIVINLFGAPGVGKSTAAAYLYHLLSSRGISTELVTEFAKDLIWDGCEHTLAFGLEQPYVFGNQLHKIERCVGSVDVIITDSPLPMTIAYDNSGSRAFKELVAECFSDYLNINCFLSFDSDNGNEIDYSSTGRIQTLAESVAMEEKIRQVLDDLDIAYVEFKRNNNRDYLIGREVLSILAVQGIEGA